MMIKDQAQPHYNRIKGALADHARSGKWLAEQIGKSENTVSRWCRNITQPSLEQLGRIAEVLDVDIKELIISTKN